MQILYFAIASKDVCLLLWFLEFILSRADRGVNVCVQGVSIGKRFVAELAGIVGGPGVVGNHVTTCIASVFNCPLAKPAHKDQLARQWIANRPQILQGISLGGSTVIHPRVAAAAA